MIRQFKYSDEILLEYGGIVTTHLGDDLPLFRKFDPDLNEAKRAELGSLIQEALREGTDEMKVAVVGDLTEKMLAEVQKCRLLFNQVRYWVIKAFPERKAIQRQFGVGRFGRLSASQPRLVEFMHELVETFRQYQAQLRAAGAPRNLLSEVEQQAATLAQANLSQEKSKGKRRIDTESRVERLNRIYGLLRAFNGAAEFVFFGEPARRELYRPPSRNQSAEEEMDEEDYFSNP